jgi:hypothetical protein
MSKELLEGLRTRDHHRPLIEVEIVAGDPALQWITRKIDA